MYYTNIHIVDYLIELIVNYDYYAWLYGINDLAPLETAKLIYAWLGCVILVSFSIRLCCQPTDEIKRRCVLEFVSAFEAVSFSLQNGYMKDYGITVFCCHLLLANHVLFRVNASVSGSPIQVIVDVRKLRVTNLVALGLILIEFIGAFVAVLAAQLLVSGAQLYNHARFPALYWNGLSCSGKELLVDGLDIAAYEQAVAIGLALIAFYGPPQYRWVVPWLTSMAQWVELWLFGINGVSPLATFFRLFPCRGSVFRHVFSVFYISPISGCALVALVYIHQTVEEHPNEIQPNVQ